MLIPAIKSPTGRFPVTSQPGTGLNAFGKATTLTTTSVPSNTARSNQLPARSRRRK